MQRYAFDKQWFAEHQKILLWFCNAPIIKYWFRWILRIHGDHKPTEKIALLLPNCLVIYKGLIWTKKNKIRHEFKLDTRTHNKFSKRLYHAFYPIWMAMHIWDLFADTYTPSLSFGFATLTVYPDAGSGATTVDGLPGRYTPAGESWNNLVTGTGNEHYDVSALIANIRIVADTTSNEWTEVTRFIATFDTSALGAGATISAATLSLFGSAQSDATGITPNLNIYGATPAANNAIADGDYQQCGSTAFSTAITYAGFSTSAYNDFALNASGISNISKTGISRFSARNAQYDVANAAPTWASLYDTYNQIKTADNTGTTNDPKLVITYTTSAAYTLAMAQGSYTLTGQTIALKKAMHLLMAQGSFTLTGQVLAFIKGRTVALAQGLFTLSGQTLNFTKAMHMTIAQGSYTLTGIALAMSRALHLTMATGYYVVTGFAQILRGFWDYRGKNTTSFSNKVRHDTTFGNKSKNSTTWTYKNED